ncbi:lipocalin-like [Anabas testudineus]|uniref:Lipocalin/cytosolic fatty-acid binding domain-containing protein n=1 Tax=Anabas testudineus TaxID=64144 RepID=A0A3Q1ISS4_ANATE|nr:lipocalin-like [Anabas testudineus]
MRNTLLLIMGTLMCILAVNASVTPVKHFNVNKMEGKWYMVAISTNAQWFANFKATMKTGTTVFTPNAEGDMDLTCSNLRADGTCWRMNDRAKRTDTPGRFTFHSQLWGNDNDMQIVDVVYNDYALVHTIKIKNGVTDIVNKLFSRKPETSVDLQQKFTEFSLQTGILSDNIVILPKNGECP